MCDPQNPCLFMCTSLVKSIVYAHMHVLLTLLLLRSERASSISSFVRSLQTSIRCLINASECTAGLLAAQWMGVSSLLFLMAKKKHCRITTIAIISYTKYQKPQPSKFQMVTGPTYVRKFAACISANIWPCRLCWSCGHMRHACHTLVDAYIPVLLLKSITLQVKKWLGHLGMALLAGQIERQISIVVLHQNCITANINQNGHYPRKCDKVTLCRHIHARMHVCICVHMNTREIFHNFYVHCHIWLYTLNYYSSLSTYTHKRCVCNKEGCRNGDMSVHYIIVVDWDVGMGHL